MGIVVLLPGGFKPPTGGHIALANYYLKKGADACLFITSGKVMRLKQSFDIGHITKVFEYYGVKEINQYRDGLKGIYLMDVTGRDIANPMTVAYNIVEHADEGTFAIGAGKNDYNNIQNFIKYFTEGKGKDIIDDDVKVVNMGIAAPNREEGTYFGRTRVGEKRVPGKSRNGDFINASTTRADLDANDFHNFKTNLPLEVRNDELKAKKVFQTLGGQLKESFDPQLLTEGGAAGHLMHPYDDLSLTFIQMKELINAALSGKLGVVQEKLDGQNLMVTYKNGEVLAARNKGHLKNAAINALTADEINQKFEGRGAIQTAFYQAMLDIQRAIQNISNKRAQEMFNEGKTFLNMEVLFPDTENVIPYGVSQLRLHNFTSYDDEGNVVDVDREGVEEFERLIQKTQKGTYDIKITNPVSFSTEDREKDKRELINSVNQLMKDYGLIDKDTLEDYYKKWWDKFITENVQKLKLNIPKQTKQALIDRWAFGIKKISLPNILRSTKSVETAKWITNVEKTMLKQTMRAATRNIERIFLQLGVKVLQSISNLASTNPSETVRRIKIKLDDAIEKIKSIHDESSLIFLKNELERLKDVGGMKAIVPTEGIVFKYNDKLYKLTGAFAPINKILGYLTFV